MKTIFVAVIIISLAFAYKWQMAVTQVSDSQAKFDSCELKHQKLRKCYDSLIKRNALLENNVKYMQALLLKYESDWHKYDKIKAAIATQTEAINKLSTDK